MEDEDKYNVCTACSILCDDIEIEKENNSITGVYTACRKGVSRIQTCNEPLPCTLDGKETDIDTAISETANILKKSENPLIFGLGNSTEGAQKKAIELAKQLNANLDDTSSFCQGPVVEAILNGEINYTCTLDDVRNNADVIVYWGADPANSHPRHLSKYTYFPRGKNRQKGYDEDRTAIAIDVRESSTAEICGNNSYLIPPQKDEELIDALIDALSGKVPKVSFEMNKKRILELANILKKAKYGVIFAGLGLVYSLDNLEPVKRLMDKLNEVSNFYFNPMIGHYNMRGFNQNLFNETGYINRVKFNDSEVKHGYEYSVVELLKNKSVDSALIIGSDPMCSLPGSIARNLNEIPIITIDSCETLTSRKSRINIPSALSGVECGGSAIRMDGVRVDFEPMIETSKLSDEEILRRVMEEV